MFNLQEPGGTINRGKCNSGSIDGFESTHYAHSNWDAMHSNELHSKSLELGSIPCGLAKSVSNNN
jgi:hypothetical protein